MATGTYIARLKAGDEVIEQEFEVILDPRTTLVSEEDVAEQEQLTLEIQAFRDEIAKLIYAMDQKKKQLETQISQEKGNRQIEIQKSKLQELYNQVVTEDGTYMQPMLRDQASYLYSMLGSADQKPGKDAYDRLEELKKQFQLVKSQFESLK